jgi:hypothetical protein
VFHEQLRVLSIDDAHVWHVTRVARFFDSVKRDASSIGRDRRENSLGDLFLACAVKIRDVNGVIAFESDALIGRKRSYAKTG